MSKLRKLLNRTERHTVSYQATDIHFTVKQLREILAEDFPGDSEVIFTAGRREGQQYLPGQRYTSDRSALLTVKLL